MASRHLVAPIWRIRLGTARASTIVICLTLAGLVVLAAVLRFVGLGWGQPFVYHPDEWVVANPAMNMARTGTWNPGYFLYPSGLIDAERLLIGVLSFFGTAPSVVTQAAHGFGGLASRGSANALPEQFTYFLAGRALVASLGVLTVVSVFVAARTASNSVGGLVAALVAAVAPLGVLNGHYLTTDVPTGFATSVVLATSLIALSRGRPWLVAAAFLAGIAASFKYNGGLVLLVPFVALIARPPARVISRSTARLGASMIVAAFVGFVLLTPAFVLDFKHVWTGGIMFQFTQYSGGHAGAEGTDNAIYFARYLFATGLGPGLALLTVAGLALTLGRHRADDAVILSFVAAYYVFVSVPPVRFERNLLPLLPFLAVVAGTGAGIAAAYLQRHLSGVAFLRGAAHRAAIPGVLLAVCVALAVPSIAANVASDRSLNNTDTRTSSLLWIENNIPAGAKIAREEFTPQLPWPTYNVGFSWKLSDKTLDWYRSAGFEYIVTSSFQFDRYLTHQPESAFYRQLFKLPIVLDLRTKAGQPGPRIVVFRLGQSADLGAGQSTLADGSSRVP